MFTKNTLALSLVSWKCPKCISIMFPNWVQLCTESVSRVGTDWGSEWAVLYRKGPTGCYTHLVNTKIDNHFAFVFFVVCLGGKQTFTFRFQSFVGCCFALLFDSLKKELVLHIRRGLVVKTMGIVGHHLWPSQWCAALCCLSQNRDIFIGLQCEGYACWLTLTGPTTSDTQLGKCWPPEACRLLSKQLSSIIVTYTTPLKAILPTERCCFCHFVARKF